MAILRHPLQHGAPLWSAARVVYLALLGAYWVWNLVHLAVDMRALAEVRHFCNHRLGLSERAVQTVSWPHVARRIVEVRPPPGLQGRIGLRKRALAVFAAACSFMQMPVHHHATTSLGVSREVVPGILPVHPACPLESRTQLITWMLRVPICPSRSRRTAVRCEARS